MVAMNSIPQQEVAKGNGQSEFTSHTYNIIQFCGENPSPTTPSGGSTILCLNYSFFYILN
jgi:hypothetical protein